MIVYIKFMEDKIIGLATLAGQKLLESGAETFRVEDTIERIIKNFGLDEAHCFCSFTGIMVSATHKGHHYSLVTRIRKRNNDLNKIILINNLSRHIKEYDVDSFEKELNRIIELKPYSIRINMLFAFSACLGFSLIFGGSIYDSLFAGLFGIFIRYLAIKFDKYEVNNLVSISILSALATFLSFSFAQLNLVEHSNIVTSSVIMLMVPGLAITNAIYDTIGGDLVSGLTRAVEAFFIAISVALGSGLIMYLFQGVLI